MKRESSAKIVAKNQRSFSKNSKWLGERPPEWKSLPLPWWREVKEEDLRCNDVYRWAKL